MKPEIRRIGHYAIISQDVTAVSPRNRAVSERFFLPIFMEAWKAIEAATGHRWKSTSYLRDSPSHRTGQAFDLAPDIAPSAARFYAVTKKSDPVLYKRTVLIRQLQTLRDIDFTGLPDTILGIFIEPDHLHLQVLANDVPGDFPTRIVKWEVPKIVYEDTDVRRLGLPGYFETLI